MMDKAKASAKRTLMRVLEGEALDSPPIWLMRQAGRYLPEYRATRKQARNFLDLCYTPDLAVEVTLQPIRRFGFDAAILFSDILVIPDALGQSVRFEEGIGPILEPMDAKAIEAIDLDSSPEQALSHLAPVFETVNRLRHSLPDETTLLGFCGAPWTVATYMIGGRGSPDQAAARLFARQHRASFLVLLDCLVEVSARYLLRQLDEGADAVQIFDSWSGSLDPASFEDFVIDPTRRMVEIIRQQRPEARIIGFPKGAGFMLEPYVRRTGVDGVGLDWSTPVDRARKVLPAQVATQGNIDPLLMVTGGEALDRAVDHLLGQTRGVPHIVNLGHGITPQGDPANVERLIRRVRG